MKKIGLICFSVVLLAGCSDQKNYQQAVLQRIQQDQEAQKELNIKDYDINVEHLAECVVDTSTKNMHGIFPLDPTRMMEYRHYTKLLTFTKSEDPKKALEELRNEFGSPKNVAEANANVTESMLECYSAMISDTEAELKK